MAGGRHPESVSPSTSPAGESVSPLASAAGTTFLPSPLGSPISPLADGDGTQAAPASQPIRESSTRRPRTSRTRQFSPARHAPPSPTPPRRSESSRHRQQSRSSARSPRQRSPPPPSPPAPALPPRARPPAPSAPTRRQTTRSLWQSFKRQCSAVLSWPGWKVWCMISAYSSAFVVPVLMVVLAASGFELVPAELRYYFVRKDSFRLGAWGWQDATSGQAKFGIFYQVPGQAWTDDLSVYTPILSGLLLLLGAAGVLYLTSFGLLAMRVFLLYTSSCSSLTMCCSAGCLHCYDPERTLTGNRLTGSDRADQRSLETWWFETTMWCMLIGAWVIGGAILVWDSQAGTEGLVGLPILWAILILASKWIVLKWLYRSSWTGVGASALFRKSRGSVRDLRKRWQKKVSKK